jgi:hypothetical protein
VKLRPEYTVELPLWLADWWELGLKPALLNDLADWQAVFDEFFDPSDGWADAVVRDNWERDAERLIERLRAALPPGVALEVDLWPLKRSA